MTMRPRFHHHLLLLLILLTGVLPWPSAQAVTQQADPPARVARLNLHEGSVAFSPAGDPEWTEPRLNQPLTQGDRLWTDQGSRAELHAGAIALRMGAQTQLGIKALNAHASQFTLTHGVLMARLRELTGDDSFEIATPNLVFRAVQGGEYRLDVDGGRGTTRVTVHSGTGIAYGENGQALALGGGQQIVFQGQKLAQASAQEAPPLDGLDRWAAERDRREDQSVSARHVPREVTGYPQLDIHGQWARDPAFGPVWFPNKVDASWAPYRHGRWSWVGPWGWTWIDDAPWGFATSHYGRWARIGARWGWVPGRMAARPVYAPALVAFIGRGTGDQSWNIQLTSGRGVAWFPLAPGEAWRPGYPASPVHVGNINHRMTVGEPASGGYAHQGLAEAITIVSVDEFHLGRPSRSTSHRPALGEIAAAQVVTAPPMPALQVATARAPLPRPALIAPPQPVVRVAQPAPVAPPAQAVAVAAKREATPPIAVPAVTPPAPVPKPAPVAPAVVSVQAEQTRRVEAQLQLAQREKVQREKVQREHAQREQARRHALAQQSQQRAQVARQQAQREKQAQAAAQTLATRRAQLQRDQAAQREAQASTARLRREQAQKDNARQEAQDRVWHEAQVRRALGLAQAEAQARREVQERREAQERRESQERREMAQREEREQQQRQAQERAMAQRAAAQREQQQRDQWMREQARREEQALHDQWQRDQWHRDQQAYGQRPQRQRPSPYSALPEQGIPVLRPRY